MQDARAFLGMSASAALEDGSLADLLYADDTLVLGESAEHVSEYGEAIEKAGAMYGMSLNWDKTQALSVRSGDRISRPDGSYIEENGSIKYLGAPLSGDGRVDSQNFLPYRYRDRRLQAIAESMEPFERHVEREAPLL